MYIVFHLYRMGYIYIYLQIFYFKWSLSVSVVCLENQVFSMYFCKLRPKISLFIIIIKSISPLYLIFAMVSKLVSVLLRHIFLKCKSDQIRKLVSSPGSSKLTYIQTHRPHTYSYTNMLLHSRLQAICPFIPLCLCIQNSLLLGLHSGYCDPVSMLSLPKPILRLVWSRSYIFKQVAFY